MRHSVRRHGETRVSPRDHQLNQMREILTDYSVNYSRGKWCLELQSREHYVDASFLLTRRQPSTAERDSVAGSPPDPATPSRSRVLLITPLLDTSERGAPVGPCSFELHLHKPGADAVGGPLDRCVKVALDRLSSG